MNIKNLSKLGKNNLNQKGGYKVEVDSDTYSLKFIIDNINKTTYDLFDFLYFYGYDVSKIQVISSNVTPDYKKSFTILFESSSVGKTNFEDFTSVSESWAMGFEQDFYLTLGNIRKDTLDNELLESVDYLLIKHPDLISNEIFFHNLPITLEKEEVVNLFINIIPRYKDLINLDMVIKIAPGLFKINCASKGQASAFFPELIEYSKANPISIVRDSMLPAGSTPGPSPSIGPVKPVKSIPELELELISLLEKVTNKRSSDDPTILAKAAYLKASFDGIEGDKTIPESEKHKQLLRLYTDAIEQITKPTKPSGACFYRPFNIYDKSKKPFFMTSGQTQYVNYCYIWFNKTNGLPITETTTNDRILTEILKYTFPYCQINQTTLSKDDKNAIINDEYTFIKTKIQTIDSNIEIVQIPRILYDLIFISYIKDPRMIKYKELLEGRSFDVDLNHGIYRDSNAREFYDNILNHNSFGFLKSDFRNTAIQVNTLICNHISMVNQRTYGFDCCKKLSIFNERNDIYIATLRTLFQNDIKKNLDNPTGDPGFISTLVDQGISYVPDRFKTIIYQTLLIEMGYIYYSERDEYFNNNDPNLFILYRGDYGVEEGTLKMDKPHSMSFNTSILNGLFKDQSATTYNYFAPSCSKKYYLIKKFHFEDGSNESKLFFIPPLHPLQLLFSSGEYWHARGKIGSDWATICSYGSSYCPSGIVKPALKFVESSLNMVELEKLYQLEVVGKMRKELIHANFNKYLKISESYEDKYLKYKNKYIKLKKKLHK